MQNKHQELLIGVRSKEKVRVVFLAIHSSVWKVDSVFQRMLNDPYFEPEILVCPYVLFGEERMQQDMEHAYQHFKQKKYPVTKAKREDGSWIKLEEMKPDILFFTNPYKLTKDIYYTAAFSNYLSCYVPYYYMATKHAGDERVEYDNMLFLHAWKVYWPHVFCDQTHKQLSPNKGENGLTLGYPAVENLYTKKKLLSANEVWKKQTKDPKRIVFAPHHTIEDSTNSLSSFLAFGEFIQALAIEYKDNVQWSFKPHPILKSKLYLHPLWGEEKTDKYYKFWQEEEYTQLDEGEYDDLFLSSDALIHDCSSFIVEYAFTRKPCLFLINQNDLSGLLNEFGEGVIQIYEKAKAAQDIEDFVNRVIAETIRTDEKKRAYFNRYVENHYKGALPSERIVDDIKQSLGALSGQC